MAFRIVIALMVLVSAKADALQVLGTDAPFRRVIESTETPANGLLLKGVFRLGDRHLLSIFETGKGVARWLAVGEERAGRQIVAYDPTTQVAEVKRAGRTERLRLTPAENHPK